MDEYAFYKNTISLLEAIKNGSFSWLVDDGWLSESEVERIVAVLRHLDYTRQNDDESMSITEKGLDVLSSINQDNKLAEINDILHAMASN